MKNKKIIKINKENYIEILNELQELGYKRICDWDCITFIEDIEKNKINLNILAYLVLDTSEKTLNFTSVVYEIYTETTLEDLKKYHYNE